MNKRTGILLLFYLTSQSLWSFTWFGERFCKDEHYTCMTIKRGQTWTELFPEPIQRDIVKRVNRTNLFLQMDMVLAVPKNLSTMTIFDVSPLPLTIAPTGDKKIEIDLKQLAWGAYNSLGQLVKWGPISPGTTSCLYDVKGCSTPMGAFRAIRKGGVDCVSKTFPKSVQGKKGGGEMPYCIFFYKGYALHGSSELPGYPASSGCVRLFVDDANWLNSDFVETAERGKKATQIIIH
jgi:hypothetical protein